jgi:RNA polymerase sigma factor (sigma-70 family)
MSDRDRKAAEAFHREQAGLWRFIRKRMPTRQDAEDILQDVFLELIEAYRVPEPLEQAGAWMFRVARNRIIDWFRKRRPDATIDADTVAPDGEPKALKDLLPSPDAGPDAIYARGVMVERLLAALDELPADQRRVFIAHEIDGRSFRDIAAETGERINTLLSRKRYAIRRLQQQLRDVYNDSERA